jgi:hypothetical protein
VTPTACRASSITTRVGVSSAPRARAEAALSPLASPLRSAAAAVADEAASVVAEEAAVADVELLLELLPPPEVLDGVEEGAGAVGVDVTTRVSVTGGGGATTTGSVTGATITSRRTAVTSIVRLRAIASIADPGPSSCTWKRNMA